MNGLCAAFLFICALAASAALAEVAATLQAPADLVVTQARIYTADPTRSMAQALAVRGDTLVYVGTNRGARAYVGPATRVEALHGRLVLPGLVDSHIHPTRILERDVCDLASRAMSLKNLSEFVRGCIERYRIPNGKWVSVMQWNYSNGNEPDAEHPTVRAALDAASTLHPIHLFGNDGHHAGFNSSALALARNGTGRQVGLSRATLAAEFASSRALIGVDAGGEPDGMVNEALRYAIDGPDEFAADADELADLMRRPESVGAQLNQVGITAVLDAKVLPTRLPFYDELANSGRLTFRAALGLLYLPELFRDADGRVDFPRMVAAATQVREHFAHQRLLRADVVKIFVDGGLEGDPYAKPPTLPNGAVLKPYLQPRFGVDTAGRATIEGYVDTESPACKAVCADPGAFETPAAIDKFSREQGYHPRQCLQSTGELYHSREDILEFVKQFHQAGFALHFHAMGDRAIRTALDAIEAARAAGGPELDRDGIAHLQLAHPDDVARIGRDHLYVAFTYSWAYVEPEYDLTVVPFFDRIAGATAAALHPPEGYYEANAYPVRAVLAAGGRLVGGSDAPVWTRDPWPFVNIARAVTRSIAGQPPLNPAQRISVREAIDSYTINGARFLGWGAQIGSLEAGKSADFIVLDRDILALADSGHAQRIEATRVAQTWFLGKRVYSASNH
jgi:predicted amidohydrolase YtcJ